MAKKPLEIDACAGSQLRDTQGEMLSVEGADISDLEAGKGRWNDNHGKGFFNSVGRITAARKIFKEEDCQDERQKYYWNKVKAPYIYVKGYLYDDEDHPNAKAAAAILRNVHKADCPLKLKASVEGGVISRGISDPSLLASTKIHSVALTFTPANIATLVEPLSLGKSHDAEADMELIKSVMHLAETNVPSFRHIARDASASKVRTNIEKIAELMKGESCIDVPTKQEILQYALEAKIQNNVAKIHELVGAATEGELEKGFKQKLAGAAMMGAAALAPNVAQAPAVAKPPTPQVQQLHDLTKMPAEHQAAYKQFAAKNPVLGAIGQVESSGGLNYNHTPDSKGYAAGGMFGMKPAAAEYALRVNPELAKKYPKLVEAAKDLDKNHQQFTDRFNSDPQAAFDFADALLRRNKLKTRGLDMLIHSWNHGLKGTWDRFKKEGPDAIANADYVKHVLEAYKKLKPADRAIAGHKKHHVKKALMAGYGGAGAPTNVTGGGVLQSESLEGKKGKKGEFKYVVCPDCGHEQVYSKYQVKCRGKDCGKAFSMDVLSKLF